MGERLSGIVQLLSGIVHPSEFHNAWDLSVSIVGSVQSNLTSFGGTAVHRERRRLLPVSSRSEDISRTAWIHSVIQFSLCSIMKFRWLYLWVSRLLMKSVSWFYDCFSFLVNPGHPHAVGLLWVIPVFTGFRAVISNHYHLILPIICSHFKSI